MEPIVPVFAYSGLFQMSSDECFGLHEPPSDSIFLTRNQQDFRDAAGIQPVHTDKQKNAPPQTRHVLQQVKCKSELARPINQLLLFRDRCDIGMLTASENIGQLECVIVLIKFEDFLGNDSNLLIVFYVQIMPDDFVMQLHRF